MRATIVQLSHYFLDKIKELKSRPKDLILHLSIKTSAPGQAAGVAELGQEGRYGRNSALLIPNRLSLQRAANCGIASRARGTALPPPDASPPAAATLRPAALRRRCPSAHLRGGDAGRRPARGGRRRDPRTGVTAGSRSESSLAGTSSPAGLEASRAMEAGRYRTVDENAPTGLIFTRKITAPAGPGPLPVEPAPPTRPTVVAARAEPGPTPYTPEAPSPRPGEGEGRRRRAGPAVVSGRDSVLRPCPAESAGYTRPCPGGPAFAARQP